MKTKLVIFGVTGDLSRRKLLPALAAISQAQAVSDLEVIGVSRRRLTSVELGDTTREIEAFSMFTMDMANEDEYFRLKHYLALGDNEQAILYLAVPPVATYQIIELLGRSEFAAENVKVLFEKPFGVDLASAEDVTKRIGRYFSEDQVYRIDHYLAKEMAQNIVAFRAGNAIFRHIWDNGAIERIEIEASEKIGIEGRAGFYEQTGALKDFVQGHLMQLLALTIMELPSELNWNTLPELRLKALQKLLPVDPARAIRAQYEGYQDEVGNPGSLTETFVSVEVYSSDTRWNGVPMRLMTGKALDKKSTEIRVDFKKFHEAQSNRLVLHIQPDEGVEIDLYTKKPGYEQILAMQKLSFSYPEHAALPDAYEQVLVDAILSRKSLFASSEEVRESWRVLQPLLDAWSMEEAPLRQYAKGATTHTICSVE